MVLSGYRVYSIVQVLLSRKYEEQFLKVQDQRKLLCALSTECLKLVELSTAEVCSCSSSRLSLFTKCVRVFANIFLNNYTKVNKVSGPSCKRKLKAISGNAEWTICGLCVHVLFIRLFRHYGTEFSSEAVNSILQLYMWYWCSHSKSRFKFCFFLCCNLLTVQWKSVLVRTQKWWRNYLWLVSACIVFRALKPYWCAILAVISLH